MYTCGLQNKIWFIFAIFNGGTFFDLYLTYVKTNKFVPPLVPEDKLPVGNVFWIAMPNAYTKSGFL